MAKLDVEKLMAAGLEFPDAAKQVIGTVRGFADRHGLAETAVSSTINGSNPYPQRRVREALAQELDVDPEWLDEQIENQQEARETTGS